MHILAISGSLRAMSSNTALLRVAAEVAPDGIEVTLYDGLGALPHFNPDDDVDVPPRGVLDLRTRIGAADGVLVCSPEYAHGVPGSLKNLFDWLVASVEFPFKPLALINASTMATHAHASLVETLTTMNANIVREACVTIPVPRGEIDANGEIASPDIRAQVRTMLDSFARAIRGMSP